jgi:hypothetical protein
LPATLCGHFAQAIYRRRPIVIFAGTHVPGGGVIKNVANVKFPSTGGDAAAAPPGRAVLLDPRLTPG